MSQDPPASPQRSPVEIHKEESRQLRGTLAEEVAAGVEHLNDANKSLIKFHGSYQQQDRDARKSRDKTSVSKHWMFMIRCKIPGGRLTPVQYLAVDELAGQFANGTLRFTSRQGIQLHGVVMKDLKATIQGINECLLTTLGACGDVNRNVMVDPAPQAGELHAELFRVGAELAAHFAPRSGAYHEIWLNGKPLTHEASGGREPPEGVPPGAHAPRSPATSHDDEPIYGKLYLPRKFKMGLAFPENNLIDIYAQDLGLLALVEGGRIAGYNLLVGGGMGMTHGNANTFPFLARPICYVPAARVLEAAEAVVKLFRDHGNRADRKRARIKYLVHDWGVEKFREVLNEYLPGPLEPPRPVEVKGFDLGLGWHAQGDGKFWYGLSVENGRVKDEGSLRLRSALRALVQQLQPELRITPMQDLLLCNLKESGRGIIERTLREHGVRLPLELSLVQQHSMACPAVPTCGLALTESERAFPAVIDQIELVLRDLGLDNEKISVRMTGCPNGCARPYQSDVGLVGRSGDRYTVFVGGNVLGTRLGFALRDLVPVKDIVPLLTPLLRNYREQRQAGEGFGDWCQRLELEALVALLPAGVGKPPLSGHAGEN